MHITDTTYTNYVQNPNFVNGLTGWAVSNGVLNVVSSPSYSGSAAQLVPSTVYAFADYALIGMTTGLPYIAQARVKASAGQPVWIQFSTGGTVQYVASGGWDLLLSQSVVQNSPSFSVQIGLGTTPQINVSDNIFTAESVAYSTNLGSVRYINAQEAVSTSDFISITSDGVNFSASDFSLVVQETINSAESYKVGNYNSNVLLVNAQEFVNSYESLYKTVTSSTQTIYIDSVMVEQATSASTYFDGDSGNGYHWLGQAENSISVARQWELAADSHYSLPQYGVLISWTRQTNSTYNAFTIGTSVIGGSDYVPGTATFPTYFNQYQYGEYSTYLTGMSVQKNIGQFPYGAFGAQLDLNLDNSSFLFLPGYDPTIGNYIINGRPVMFEVGYNGELIAIFSGISTKPQNDVKNRTLKLTAFDGMDYLNSFKSQGAGPIAAASNGYYANTAAQNIIGDLLAEAGFSTSQYYAEQSLQSNIGFLAPKGRTVGEIIQKICEAEQALFFFDENGIPNFWNRYHIPTNNTVQWSFAYKSILDYSTEDTPIINDVIITAKPRVVQAKQNIWQLTSGVSVPSAQATQTVTNMAVNPNFKATTGGYFNSPLNVSASENSTTTELLFENLKTPDGSPISQTPNQYKPIINDYSTLTESYSVKVGAGAAFVSSPRINVYDSTAIVETYGLDIIPYVNEPLVFIESIATSEFLNVKLINASLKPTVYDSTYTTEYYTIDSHTMIGWNPVNATILTNNFDSAPGTTAGTSGQLTTNGTINSYIYQNYTVTTKTQYVSQMYVKAAPGVGVTAQIVQNGHVVASNQISASGGWDLLKISPFTSENTVTTMQLQILTDTAGTIGVGGVMTQLGVGATSNYFDGGSSPTSSYVYSWSGVANQSTSVATPCGFVTIEADFQDNDGDLPVTLVDKPTYNNSNLTSTYLTNLNSDGTGLTGSAYIQLQSAVLNGSKYLMTFINTYTQPIYITNCSLYGTPAKVTYSISQEYKDPSSIVLYGTNPTNNGSVLAIQNDLIQDPSTAQSNAYTLVNDYSKPYQRIVANVFPNYALQIGDAIQATIDDTGSSLVYTIVGITNSISDQGEPSQSLELEVKKLVHYFTINTSAIGGTDSIAP